VEGGARIEDVFTVGKLLALGVFIIGAMMFFKAGNFYPLLPATTNTSALTAVGIATVPVLWAYLGQEIITVPDDEIKNARKTVPKAIIIAVLTVTAIYMLVAVAFLGASRWTNFVGSQSPLSDLFRSVTGSQIGGIIITLGGLISIIGSLNAVILATARISFSMSRDGLFPKVFAKIHPKYKTPYTAIILQTVFALILTYTVTDFVTLAKLAVFFTIVPYALSSFATYRLIVLAKGKLHVLSTRAIPLIAGVLSVVLIVFYLTQLIVLEIACILLFIGLLIFIERKTIRKL
jgi:amino acid transporter